MCNLYSITTNQAAIIALFRVILDMSAICLRCHRRLEKRTSELTPSCFGPEAGIAGAIQANGHCGQLELFRVPT